jgi:hypothetical protein
MVSEPHKEIRFTRSGQGRNFAILGAVLIGVAVTMCATAPFRSDSERLALFLGSIPCYLLAVGFFWLCFHCTRHAFLILSPVGIELFPLIKPAKNFRLFNWAQFHEAEIREKKLYLHSKAERTGGAVISLSPLTSDARTLLTRAIEGRMEERFQA